MYMSAVRKQRWTLPEVEKLIDARPGYTPRYELADGELLVTPAPNRRHQRIVFELAVLLRECANRHGIGEVCLGPSAVRLTDDSYFEPDICVDPAVGGRRPRADGPVTHLLLSVEVLSPGSIRHDRVTKRHFYQEHGVPEYWIVDGDSLTFETWRPEDERPAMLDRELNWRPDGAAEPFVLDIAAFFASVADDIR